MIHKITIRNFKAIQSAAVKHSDLSVFIGNNRSGKSSLIEALQTLQEILLHGISTGFTNRNLKKILNHPDSDTQLEIVKYRH